MKNITCLLILGVLFTSCVEPRQPEPFRKYEVTYSNGDKDTVYGKDPLLLSEGFFNSGEVCLKLTTDRGRRKVACQVRSYKRVE